MVSVAYGSVTCGFLSRDAGGARARMLRYWLRAGRADCPRGNYMRRACQPRVPRPLVRAVRHIRCFVRYEMTHSESHYRLRDLLLPPAWFSLLRVPLAVCFVALVDHPRAAFAVLVAAGASDLLDGWLARRYQMVTATGAALDPITDKVFVFTVAVALVASRHLAPSAVLLLSTRELGELLLMAWLAAHRAPHVAEPTANGPGKLSTVVQFVTVGWMLFRAPLLNVWLIITAVMGAFAALSYWRRALQSSAVRPLHATRRTPD